MIRHEGGPVQAHGPLLPDSYAPHKDIREHGGSLNETSLGGKLAREVKISECEDGGHTQSHCFASFLLSNFLLPKEKEGCKVLKN